MRVISVSPEQTSVLPSLAALGPIRPDTRAVVLDLHTVPFIDVTATRTLDTPASELRRRNVQFLAARKSAKSATPSASSSIWKTDLGLPNGRRRGRSRRLNSPAPWNPVGLTPNLRVTSILFRIHSRFVRQELNPHHNECQLMYRVGARADTRGARR